MQLFCEIDDFTQSMNKSWQAGHLLPVNPKGKHSTNEPCISLSEMMTLKILYHLSVQTTPSYNRFVELKPRMLIPLICCLHCLRLGTFLGLYYADSTALKSVITAASTAIKYLELLLKEGKVLQDGSMALSSSLLSMDSERSCRLLLLPAMWQIMDSLP